MKWTTEQINTVQKALEVDRAKRFARKDFPASPIGFTQDGLADFRKLPFSGAKNTDIVDADMTGIRSQKNEYGVSTGLTFTSCRVLRVRFDGGSKFHSLDGIFDQCSFDNIKTERCGFVGLFRDCTFRGANLRRAMFNSNFVRCVFEGAQLQVASWGSSFEDCQFIDCKIDPIFADIADYVKSGEPVTFSILSSGKIRPRETASYFSRNDLIRDWPPDNE